MSNSASSVAQFDGSSRGHSSAAYPIQRKEAPLVTICDSNGTFAGYRHRASGKYVRMHGRGFRFLPIGQER